MRRVDYILIGVVLLVVIGIFIGVKIGVGDGSEVGVGSEDSEVGVENETGEGLEGNWYDDLGWDGELFEEVQKYNDSQKIMDLINNEFEIIEGDNNIISAGEVYDKKTGTEYELMRLIYNVLLYNNYQGAIFFYEFEGGNNMVLNFRDIEEPKYYYFEDGVLKMQHHGWSFNDLVKKEEERNNVKITRYGVYSEGDLISKDKIDVLLNIADWVVVE